MKITKARTCRDSFDVIAAGISAGSNLKVTVPFSLFSLSSNLTISFGLMPVTQTLFTSKTRSPTYQVKNSKNNLYRFLKK